MPLLYPFQYQYQFHYQYQLQYRLLVANSSYNCLLFAAVCTQGHRLARNLKVGSIIAVQARERWMCEDAQYRAGHFWLARVVAAGTNHFLGPGVVRQISTRRESIQSTLFTEGEQYHLLDCSFFCLCPYLCTCSLFYFWLAGAFCFVLFPIPINHCYRSQVT